MQLIITDDNVERISYELKFFIRRFKVRYNREPDKGDFIDFFKKVESEISRSASEATGTDL